MSDSLPSADYDATPRGRLLFAFHWCAWKIGKALYPPRLVRTRVTPPVVRTCGCGPDDPPCQKSPTGGSGHLYGDGIPRARVFPSGTGRAS